MIWFAIICGLVNVILWIIFFRKNHDKEDYFECIISAFVFSFIGTLPFIAFSIWEIIKKIFKIKGGGCSGIADGYYNQF